MREGLEERERRETEKQRNEKGKPLGVFVCLGRSWQYSMQTVCLASSLSLLNWTQLVFAMCSTACLVIQRLPQYSVSKLIIYLLD